MAGWSGLVETPGVWDSTEGAPSSARLEAVADDCGVRRSAWPSSDERTTPITATATPLKVRLTRASATTARTECHARRCTHGRQSSRRRVGARCAAPDGGPAWLLTVTVAPGAGATPSGCRLLSAQGQGMLM